MNWWEAARAEFPHQEMIYVDHALRGPLPQRSRQALQDALLAAQRGSLARGAQQFALAETRVAIARFMGWPADCVTFTANTTTALALLAHSLPWDAGDRVLLHADEVPANRLPWEALRPRGVVCTVLPSRSGCLGLEDLEAELKR